MGGLLWLWLGSFVVVAGILWQADRQARREQRREFAHETDDCTGRWFLPPDQFFRCTGCSARHPWTESAAKAAWAEENAAQWLQLLADEGEAVRDAELVPWLEGGPQ